MSLGIGGNDHAVVFYISSSTLLTSLPSIRRPNYLLKFHLEPKDIVDPAIHRTLSYPSTATFADLHRALQIAFGWADTHTYDFKIKDPVIEAAWAAKEASMGLLDYIRRVERADRFGDCSGNKQCLLRIVEDKPAGRPLTSSGQPKVDFMHDGNRIHPKTPQKTGSKVRLFQVFDNDKYQGKPMEYEYDFGDSWFHEITLLGRKDATSVFQCVAGDGHGCAEDVGSIKGWSNLKAAFRASRPSQEQKEDIRWYTHVASNGDHKGLGGGRDRIWVKETINAKLATLRI